MDYRVAIFTFIGGLGFFLYGIKSMSEGLQAVAGDKMRVFLEKGTKTPLRGVFTGALVTALIQSSSGTTVNRCNYGCKYWYDNYCLFNWI